MAKKSYSWFERRRKTKALDLAQQQITKALDTVTMLHQAIQNISEAKKEKAMEYIEGLFKVEKEVGRLRTEVFKEMSRSAALFSRNGHKRSRQTERKIGAWSGSETGFTGKNVPKMCLVKFGL